MSNVAFDGTWSLGTTAASRVIANWAAVLRADNKAIWTAGARATEAVAGALELQGSPATPITISDHAILHLAFASGRRRAEIGALDVEDLDFGRPGFLIVTIRKSKTDQGGAGHFAAVPRLDRWSDRLPKNEQRLDDDSAWRSDVSARDAIDKHSRSRRTEFMCRLSDRRQ